MRASRPTAPPRAFRTAAAPVLFAVLLLLPLLPAAPAAAGTCSVPFSQSHRSIPGTFDQCVERSFTSGGTSYSVQVYYTETQNAGDAQYCTDNSLSAASCEHALADIDDASGDNTRAVQVADETIAALEFYFTRARPIPIISGTDMQVFIGEDARGGGIPTCSSLWWDDEWVDPGDPLTLRVLAFHEAFHLAQFCQYDQSTGSHGEGVARALEDRVDPALDTNLGNLFIPEVSQHLSLEGPGVPDAMGNLPAPRARGDALDDQWYWSMLWWTYVFDQLRAPGDTEPILSWDGIDRFYDAMASNATDVGAVSDVLGEEGMNFRDTFRRYGQAMWAHKFNPSDPALRFIDSEITASTPQLNGHTVRNGSPAVQTDTFTVNPRSNRYIEYRPGAGCEAVTFDFDGKGQSYGWAVLGAEDPNLVTRSENYSGAWSATVLVGDLDRVVGIVTSTGSSGQVDVDSGCAALDVEIESPTTSTQAVIGQASDPDRLLVRVDVDGPGGDPVQGLSAGQFDVELARAGSTFPATVLSSAEVQSDYWLLVQPPTDADGVQTGLLYDLTVGVGGAEATNASAVLYAEQPDRDLLVVTDQSGSMSTSGKIVAARNAGELLVEELSDEDQAGYTAFDEVAVVREMLAPVGVGGHREDVQNAIRAEMPDGATSIGAGMRAAATDHDARGLAANTCAFVLLSDGAENSDPRWTTVMAEAADNGCPIHAVGLGPGANEPLLQQIAGAVPGGSYDYAGTGPDGGAFAQTGGPHAGGATTWQNGLASIYDLAATRVGDRERVVSIGYDEPPGAVTCTTQVTTSDFSDANPEQIGVGQSMTSGGTTFEGVGYAGGTDGSAFVTETDEVRFGFLTLIADRLACQAEFDIRYFNAQPEVHANGVARTFSSFSEIDGTTLGGAQISVVNQGQEGGFTFGTIRLTGDLSSYGVGGNTSGGEFPAQVYLGAVRITLGQPGGIPIQVDGTAGRLLATVNTQNPVSGQMSRLYRPDGSAEPVSSSSKEPHGSSEVWTVVDPVPGEWRLVITNVQPSLRADQRQVLVQPVLATASLETDLRAELLLPAGTELVDSAVQGVEVPIVAVVSSPGGPVTGAQVTATITDPDGFPTTKTLYDDGNHGDGLPNDGFYAASYTATSFGDVVTPNPADGAEPQVGGSYRVDLRAVIGPDVRLDSGAFALAQAPDGDLDGLPDPWEIEHGLDPNDPDDAGSDGDDDGLDATCEFEAGTDPRTNDSDGGGTADGHEVQLLQGRCRPGPTDPNDPNDDPTSPLKGVVIFPTLDANGTPVVEIHWDGPQDPNDTLIDVDIRCQPLARVTGTPTGPFELVAENLTSSPFVLTDVVDGDYLRCRVRPNIDGVDGSDVTTQGVPVEDDPYPPEGTILIDNGAARTPDAIVDLQLTVDDLSAPGHAGPDGGGFAGADPVPGSSPENLEMRIVNGAVVPDSALWVPYAAEVEDWALSPDATGLARVTVQFRDEAGNIGAGGLFQTDSILVDARRLQGPSRIETAVAISQDDFPADGSADAAIVARSDTFPDALAGGPLAVAKNAPLLLTQSDSLHPATQTELLRVLPPGRTVFVLGGTAAVADDVLTSIRGLGFQVQRVSGATRVETAVAIADELGSPGTLFLAHAYDFPDPLIAAAAAPGRDGAVLLTGDGVPEAPTDAYLASRPGLTVYAVGEPAATAYPAAAPFAGDDPASTSVLVANEFFPNPVIVGIARDDDFPDALAGGAHIARRDGPIMLTNRAALSSPVETYLCANEATLETMVVYGGTAAISDEVYGAASNRIRGVDC